MLGHVATSIGGALPGVGGKASALLQALLFQPGNHTWTAPVDGTVVIYGFGAGGYGRPGGTSGGGGGAAFKKTLQIKQGQQITFSVPRGGQVDNAGCVVSWPGGTATAGGGRSVDNGRAGGVATGGDINRSGGSGGAHNNNGSAGHNGGDGGLKNDAYAGGGGAGGFSDENGPVGGKGATGGYGVTNSLHSAGFPGGGGGATATGQAQSNSWFGADGAAFLHLIGEAP